MCAKYLDKFPMGDYQKRCSSISFDGITLRADCTKYGVDGAPNWNDKWDQNIRSSINYKDCMPNSSVSVDNNGRLICNNVAMKLIH